MILKNRIVMTAMHLGYTPGGQVTDRLVKFYALRARGGCRSYHCRRLHH
jgi:2,4-dienoyl-CoA reductase (NADPH2)